MEEEIRAILAADSAVSAIVAGRLNWGAHPQGAPLPGLVLNFVGETGSHTVDGQPTGLFVSRVQIDAYATAYGAATQLSRAVRSVLDGHRSGIIKAVFFADARGGREDGVADRPFRVSTDFMVHHIS